MRVRLEVEDSKFLKNSQHNVLLYRSSLIVALKAKLFLLIVHLHFDSVLETEVDCFGVVRSVLHQHVL